MATPLRLADLLGGLSIVCDLGFGLPPQAAMRSCVLATAFARKLDLPERRAHDAFYAALLMHVGCVATALESARAFGDEIHLTRSISTINISDWKAVAGLVPTLTRDMPPLRRARVAAFAVTKGAAWGRDTDRGSCEIAREAARRLGLPETTQRALYDMYEWWNGHGPRGVGGDDIDLVARVIMVAADAAYFDELGGEDAVTTLLRQRVGVLDPHLVEAFLAAAPSLLAELNAGDPREQILAVEPHPVVERPPTRLAEVAGVFGDATDMKLPAFHGHSRRVAALACDAASALGLPLADIDQLHVAALLHDIGRAGVSTAIWQKPGPLTAAEWEQVRMHAYHSERILACSTALAPLARIAGMHHERQDGSGYHRNARAGELAMPARILAVADAYSAMTAKRPHRPALAGEQAAARLTAEATAGRLDVEAVAAVSATAGHRPARTPARPAGLSEREVDVLRLLAQGLSNAEIGKRLYISRRTAEHHVQHIYAKIGVSTRAAAAMFGLEHGLLVPIEGAVDSK